MGTPWCTLSYYILNTGTTDVCRKSPDGYVSN